MKDAFALANAWDTRAKKQPAEDAPEDAAEQGKQVQSSQGQPSQAQQAQRAQQAQPPQQPNLDDERKKHITDLINAQARASLKARVPEIEKSEKLESETKPAATEETKKEEIKNPEKDKAEEVAAATDNLEREEDSENHDEGDDVKIEDEPESEDENENANEIDDGNEEEGEIDGDTKEEEEEDDDDDDDDGGEIDSDTKEEDDDDSPAPQKKQHSKRKHKVSIKISPKKILIALLVLIFAALIAIFTYAALDRWAFANDEADIQGTWKVQGQANKIIITEDKIKLTDDATYSYTLDTQTKCINETLGNMSGCARYRFSADKRMVAIFDSTAADSSATTDSDATAGENNSSSSGSGGRSNTGSSGGGTTSQDGSPENISWIDTAKSDFSWAFSCIIANITGATAPDLLGGEAGIILYK